MTRQKKRLQTDERRAQLLELGVELFGRLSYEEVSIDEIAARAGVSKGLLYHYFGSKKDFYIECLRRSAQQLVDAVWMDAEMHPVARMSLGIVAYLNFVQERKPAFRTLMRGGLGADPDIVEIVESARNTIIQRMLDQLPLEDVVPGPPFRMALKAWIGAVEFASLDWLEHDDLPQEQVVQLLLENVYSVLTTAARIQGVPPIEF